MTLTADRFTARLPGAIQDRDRGFPWEGWHFTRVDVTPGALTAAVEWLQSTLLGSIATAVAIVAVAGVGLQALTGRADLRRAARVLLGCFILFGATSIAAGLRQIAGGGASARLAAAPMPAPTPAWSAIPYDPYAGAAVPER